MNAPFGDVIIDDHRMFGESLTRLLAAEADIAVLGVASSGGGGVELAAAFPSRWRRIVGQFRDCGVIRT